MEAVRKPEVAAPRLRHVALLLMSAEPDAPVAHSKALSAPGRGERVGSPSMSEREIGAVLAQMDEEAGEDGSIVELAAQRKQHPAYRRLDRALEELRVRDEWAHRLLVWTFLGRSGVAAMVHLHAVCHVAKEKPLRQSASGALLSGLLALSELLGDAPFPRVVYEQEQAWERWLAAIRPKAWIDSEGRTRSLAPAALELRNMYVRELVSLGLAQARVATHVGLSQPQVSRIVDHTERMVFPFTPPEKRAGMRAQNSPGDQRSCDERQADWEKKRVALDVVFC